jgi:hypothetical protein
MWHAHFQGHTQRGEEKGKVMSKKGKREFRISGKDLNIIDIDIENRGNRMGIGPKK